MVFPICIYGSGVLRAETENIAEGFEGLEKLVEDMFETMYDSDGVGLAAPQIGKALRLFVIDTTVVDEEGEEPKGLRKAFVNPEIYDFLGDEISCEEGCLSIPGIHENVMRPAGVRIRYMDEKMQPHDDTFDGFVARVIQHEYDHLEGKMFVDRLTPLRKTLLKGKLTSMSKGKYSASYKTKLIK